MDFLVLLTIIKKLKILMYLSQLMTCKDAINSDTSSDEEKLYLLNEIRRSSNNLELNIEKNHNLKSN